jgi:hypothetical protein
LRLFLNRTVHYVASRLKHVGVANNSFLPSCIRFLGVRLERWMHLPCSEWNVERCYMTTLAELPYLKHSRLFSVLACLLTAASRLIDYVLQVTCVRDSGGLRVFGLMLIAHFRVMCGLVGYSVIIGTSE